MTTFRQDRSANNHGKPRKKEKLKQFLIEEIGEDQEELKAVLSETVSELGVETPKSDQKSQPSELMEEGKGVFQEFMDSVFGDFLTFWSIFKTTGYWFVFPLSLDIRVIGQQIKIGAKRSFKYMTDVQLLKSLFLFLILFLIVESSIESQDAEGQEEELVSNEVIMQIVFLLFYAGNLVAFLAGGWLWKKIMGVKPESSRQFFSFLIYEFCVIFFLQGIVSAIFELRLSSPEEDGGLEAGFFIGYLIPFLHCFYFFRKLRKFYDANKAVVSFLFVLIVIGFILIWPAATAEVFFLDGVSDE